MKLNFNKITLLSLTFFVVAMVNGQSLKQKVADKYFDQLNYVSAVEVYKDIVSSKHKDYHNLKRTSECYRLMNNTNDAEFWYKQLIDFGTDFPKDYYLYAQLLKRNGKYDLSDKNLETFYEKGGKGTFTSIPNYYEKLKSDSAYFIVSQLGFNGPESDMAPMLYNGDLLFVSNRRKKIVSNVKVGWDETNFLDVYTVGNANSNTEPKLFFGKDLTKNSHDGPICFDTINNMIYITRNSVVDKNVNKTLKVDVIPNSETEWTNSKELPFNNDSYSVGHVSMSVDSKTIYFTSNMPGGFGESDIWKSNYSNGTWSAPVNLGEAINTFDKELFPFISSNGDLYFASQGHQGLGGLDIFVAYKDGEGFTKPVNLGYPINTRFDDFSFIVTSSNQVGYFASNRVGGQGDDDVYKVEIKKQFAKPQVETDETVEVVELTYVLQGHLFDENDNAKLIGAKVLLKNLTTGAEQEKTITENGFEFILEPSTDYEVSFTQELYTDKMVKISSDEENYLITLNESLAKKAINIDNIYYVFNSYKLSPTSKTELNELVNVLKEFPNMKIQLNSHTDCKGTADYNLKLSDRRAKAVVNYLVEKGIDKNRLSHKGYGESKPVNNCKDGSNCTDEQFKMNRRTEFVILK